METKGAKQAKGQREQKIEKGANGVKGQFAGVSIGTNGDEGGKGE